MTTPLLPVLPEERAPAFSVREMEEGVVLLPVTPKYPVDSTPKEYQTFPRPAGVLRRRARLTRWPATSENADRQSYADAVP